MAYNKAKEERKWRLWKEEEEKRLRQLGVGEDIIRQLRAYDWKRFNSDRRYYQKVQDTGTYIEEIAESSGNIDFNAIETFLDDIENEQLYKSLKKVDKLTLQIILLKMQGYSTNEIAEELHLTTKSIYRRIDRFKEKIKKFIN